MTTGARFPVRLGVARLGKVQGGIVSARTITGVANIGTGVTTRTITGKGAVVSGVSVRRAIFPFRLGLSVLGIFDRSESTSVQTQSGVAKIIPVILRDIQGLAYIHPALNTKHQTGVANIHSATNLKSITGVAFIHSISQSRVQYGVASIHPASSAPTQIGKAYIVSPGTRLKLQPGKAYILAETSSPTIPGSLAVSLSGSCNVLTWTASTDVVSVSAYLIERCSGPGCSGFVQIASVSGSTLTYTDCPGPGSWTYRIRATNPAGLTSGPSGTVTSVITAATTQMIGGVANIGTGPSRTITGVASVQSATPSLGIRLTQQTMMVARHPEPISGGNSGGLQVALTQVVANVAKYPTAKKINLSQVVLLVATPYLGAVNIAYSQDNFGVA